MNLYTIKLDKNTVTIVSPTDYDASLSAFFKAHPDIDVPVCAWYRHESNILDIKADKGDKTPIDSAVVVGKVHVGWDSLRGRFIYTRGPNKGKAVRSTPTVTADK
jgi:hypothetical protein